MGTSSYILNSGECWLELTDSGSMQEELFHFPKVNFITVSTDRPETVSEAFGNILTPPINPEWIVEIVRLANLVKVPFLSKGINAWGFGKKMIRTLGFLTSCKYLRQLSRTSDCVQYGGSIILFFAYRSMPPTDGRYLRNCILEYLNNSYKCNRTIMNNKMTIVLATIVLTLVGALVFAAFAPYLTEVNARGPPMGCPEDSPDEDGPTNGCGPTMRAPIPGPPRR